MGAVSLFGRAALAGAGPPLRLGRRPRALPGSLEPLRRVIGGRHHRGSPAGPLGNRSPRGAWSLLPAPLRDVALEAAGEQLRRWPAQWIRPLGGRRGPRSPRGLPAACGGGLTSADLRRCL